MAFAKLVFGVLLVGLGGILLAGHMGFLPSATGHWILRYWPILLVAIGLALLANAVRSPALGLLATAIVIGALAFAAWWAYHHGVPAVPDYWSSIDLGGQRVQNLTVRTRVFGGVLSVGARRAGAGRRLDLSARGVGDSANAAPRYRASGRAGILDWPHRGTQVFQAPFGARLEIMAPRQTGLRLEARSLLSEVRADLSRLRPERIDVKAMASSVRVTATGPLRPELVRVRGALSAVELLLPASCPVRLEIRSPLTIRSLPEDFVKSERRDPGDRGSPGDRGNRRDPGGDVWTSDGAGRVIRVEVDAPLIHFRIRREAVPAT